MAATDMSKAQYEPGCRVVYRPFEQLEGSFSLEEKQRLQRMRDASIAATFTFTRQDFPWVYLRQGSGFEIQEHYSLVEREFDDAQAARQKRYGRLIEVWPDAFDHSDTDTLERFCCPLYMRGDTVATYVWGDTFEDCAREAGGYVLDGQLPQGIFDLDTGEKIDLHIASPVITASEDQHATVNELDADEVAESEAYVEQNYDHVATSFTVNATVPADRGDDLAHALDLLLSQSWVEHAELRREEIRQHRPTPVDQEA